MGNNITCNGANREDIDALFETPGYNIDYFICGTDIDNSFGGKMTSSNTTFMYAKSTGFVGWNTTERGATLITIKETKTSDCNSSVV
jgi:hypothetical protein